MLRKIAITIAAGASALTFLAAVPASAHDTAFPIDKLYPVGGNHQPVATGAQPAQSMGRLSQRTGSGKVGVSRERSVSYNAQPSSYPGEFPGGPRTARDD